MNLGASFRRAGAAAVLVVACAGGAGPEPLRPAPELTGAAGGSPPLATAAATQADAGSEARPDDYEVALRDPELLAALEAKGFGLSELVHGAEARTTAELNRLSGFASIFDVLRADVRAAKTSHPLARVTSSDGYRLFDERWFDSHEMRFVLSGVFNRLDRRAFYPETCGEIRFLYRLAYQTKHAGAPMAGRLPLTMNVVFLVRGDQSCRAVARTWQIPRDARGAAALPRLFTGGPLAQSERERWTLKSIETNLQTFRIQSFAHPTLAGHIDYVLRVFHAKGDPRDAFEAVPMENMPDVARLSANPKLRAELLHTLKNPTVLAAIDQGTLNLPERFLATRALSVSPRGLTRAANRPFRTLFEDADFANLPLEGTRTIRSPAALIRRLDGATCSGCHQSRSIAGFHHVGNDSPEHPAFDALVSGSSAHLENDLERRRLYVSRVAAGETTDEYRPIPERQGTGSGFGAPCGLGDHGFSDWTCDGGLRCEKLEDTEIGTCVADRAIGSPCQYGEVVSRPKPLRDHVAGMKKLACDERQFCHDNRSGFPLGACEAACNSGSTAATCADFLDADAFQSCLRSKKTFEACAKQHVFGAGLRACDGDDPCRQDYVCVRSRTPGVGACVPPYFVYQLRLDGYPLLR